MVVVLGAAPPQLLPRELSYRGGLENPSAGVGFSSIPVSSGACRSLGARGRKLRRGAWVQTSAFWQQQKDSPRPDSVEMEPINSSEHLDEILRRCQEEEPHSIVIDWMAAWCRKCIYLTPKLEKLAAEYHTKIKFYYVDVNKVSQALVKRGNISKMPTIQLWKDGEMKAEIIGGHKAWLVVEEVREMIQHNI